MSAVAATLFEALPAWQRMLERHGELFCDMAPGSRIGLMRRNGAQPGKRAAALFASGAEVLTWERGEDGMRAGRHSCCDPRELRLDLLLVADDEGLEAIAGHIEGDALTVMKKLIRRGNVLFYAMRTKHELEEAGYEDFLDSLGLAFLGACR
jgi:hypothetical protein